MKKAVRVILWDPEKGVLAGRRVKTGYGHNQWALFGGKPDGEESLAEAARREVKEEVGVDTEPKEYADVIDDGSDEPWHVTFFVSEFTGDIVLDKREHSELTYITPENIDELDIAFTNHRPVLKRFFKEKGLVN